MKTLVLSFAIALLDFGTVVAHASYICEETPSNLEPCAPCVAVGAVSAGNPDKGGSCAFYKNGKGTLVKEASMLRQETLKDCNERRAKDPTCNPVGVRSPSSCSAYRVYCPGTFGKKYLGCIDKCGDQVYRYGPFEKLPGACHEGRDRVLPDLVLQAGQACDLSKVPQ